MEKEEYVTYLRMLEFTRLLHVCAEADFKFNVIIIIKGKFCTAWMHNKVVEFSTLIVPYLGIPFRTFFHGNQVISKENSILTLVLDQSSPSI